MRQDALHQAVLVWGNKSVQLFGESHKPQQVCSRKGIIEYILSCVSTQVYLEMPMNMTVDAATRAALSCQPCNSDTLNALRTCAIMQDKPNVFYCDPREVLGTLPFTPEERAFVQRQRNQWNTREVTQRFLIPILTSKQLKMDFPQYVTSQEQLADKSKVFSLFCTDAQEIWTTLNFQDSLRMAISEHDIIGCVKLFHDATDLLFELVVFSMVVTSDKDRHLFYGGYAHSRTIEALLLNYGFKKHMSNSQY